MTNEHRRVWSSAGLVFGVGLFLMTGMACTDAEVIRLESSDTVVSIQPSALSLPFSRAEMDLSGVIVRPATPEGQAGSGGQTTAMVSNQTTVTIDLLTGRTIDGRSLRPGRWEIVSMRLSRVPVAENDSPAPIGDPNAECWEKIALFDQTTIPGGGSPLTLEFENASDPPVFTVESGPWEVPILIDTDAFLRAYVDATQCNDIPGGNCQGIPAPCVDTFDSVEFRQNALAAFSSR